MNIIFDTLERHIPKFRRRASGWSKFNAICCVYNGESRPDTRLRGGLKLEADGSCVYYCFNCKYSASWTPGRRLSSKMENLLDWAYVGQEEKNKIKWKIWQLWMNAKSQNPVEPSKFSEKVHLKFNTVALPSGAKPFSHWLQPENFRTEFAPVANYVIDRGLDIYNAYEYYWTPEPLDLGNGRFDRTFSNRVIIPFHWEGQIVGYTARDVSGKAKNRYFSSVQPNFIFNTESIAWDNEYIFVCEGPFDALAIGGVAMLGDKVSKEQAEWLNNTGKKIVVVPDREKLGGKLVDVALEQGWYVTFPAWGDNMRIKDAADAVRELGKIYTLLSITDAMINSAFHINVKRKIILRAK